MKTATKLVTMGLIAWATAAWAANPPASLVMIPAQINYQGRLVTTSNTPYADAVHTIDLTLYATASGGEKLWSERYGVLTKDGYFSVNLGSGGQGQLPTNREIWQVMWRTNSSPDTLFMAMTVRTTPSGASLAFPVEATPRQQFMTTPFAYRSHQSLYASKADTLFDAPDGVQTPRLTATNTLRLESVNTMTLESHNALAMYCTNIMMIGSFNNYLGLFGTRLNLGTVETTTNILVNSKAMFVLDFVSTNAPAGTTSLTVYHSINTAEYDIMPVHWYSSYGSVRGVYSSQNSSFVGFYWESQLPSSSQVLLRVLGIRKGLIQYQ